MQRTSETLSGRIRSFFLLVSNAAAVGDPIQLASHALLISLLSSACVDPFLTTVDPWEALRTLRSFSVLTLTATFDQNKLATFLVP